MQVNFARMSSANRSLTGVFARASNQSVAGLVHRVEHTKYEGHRGSNQWWRKGAIAETDDSSTGGDGLSISSSKDIKGND